MASPAREGAVIVMRAIIGAIMFVAPLVALAMQLKDGAGMAERHHRHHDSYAASPNFLRALVVVMLFMSVLGILLAWLCRLGVYSANDLVLLSFFASFVLVTFVLWACVRRYRVVTYADYMDVTPPLGMPVKVAYNDIERIERAPAPVLSGQSDVRLYVGGDVPRVIRLWGMVDVEQVLLRVNRFEVLDDSVY
jgi:hypothetical protein